jgi:hypothetical protein
MELGAGVQKGVRGSEIRRQGTPQIPLAGGELGYQRRPVGPCEQGPEVENLGLAQKQDTVIYNQRGHEVGTFHHYVCNTSCGTHGRI